VLFLVCPLTLVFPFRCVGGGVYLLVLGVSPSWCKQSIHPDIGFETPRFYWLMMTLYRFETTALITSILEVSIVVFIIFWRCMLVWHSLTLFILLAVLL